MVNKFPLFLLLLCVGFCVQPPLYGSQNPFAVRFPLKEGIIHYAIRGSVEGTKVLYFRDYGAKELIIEQTRGNILTHPKTKQKAVLIRDGEKYTIDLTKKEIRKEPLLTNLLEQKFRKLTQTEQKSVLKNLQNMPDRSWENLDRECISNAKKIENLWCTREQIEGKDQCSIAHGLLILDSDIDILGFHVKEFVTKIEDKSPDPQMFQLPPNIPVTKAEQDLSHTANQILKKLTDTNRSFACKTQKHTAADREGLQQSMYREIQKLSKNF
ncbi:MAG: hypothetical protein DSZ05_07645 [Sulfurospirillum sp.]|nr:MAG: hypothetical protein DSZ05_07645 [Sulfurospirillum sp.]